MKTSQWILVVSIFLLVLVGCQAPEPVVIPPAESPSPPAAEPLPAPVPPVIVSEPTPPVKKGEVIPRIERQELTVEGDDAGIYPNTITVKKGSVIQITFKVRQARTYYGGLDFRSEAWGDTGRIPPGGSKTIEFTAEDSFDYTSYWPSSNVKKATGKVVIE